MSPKFVPPLVPGIPLAFAILCTAGCPTGGGSDDDDDTTPVMTDDDTSGDDDDDTSGDDDDDTTPSGPPAWTWDHTDLAAGAWEVFVVDIENFDVAAATNAGAPELILQNFQDLGGGSYQIDVIAGLLADGPYSMSLTSGDDTLEQELNVSPVVATELPISMAAATGAIEEARGYDLFRLDLPEESAYYYIRATQLGNEDFHPFLWIWNADGLTAQASAGGPDTNDVYPTEPMVHFPSSGGTLFLRVDDFAFAGDAAYTYTLDVAAVPVPPPVAVPEVEPNDQDDEWQDLGVLGLGSWNLTGSATTAGHDAKTYDPTGDFDGFTFSTSEEFVLALEMSWADVVNDFDLLVFNLEDGAPAISFESEALLATDTATTAMPEAASVALPAGTYLAVIFEWDGTPADWTTTITLASPTFPSP